MADVKINQLPNKTTLADTDVVIVESATQTQKMTAGKLKEHMIDEFLSKYDNRFATSGYQKFPNGLIIQLGQDVIELPNTNTVYDKVVTLPIPFPNLKLSQMVTLNTSRHDVCGISTTYGSGLAGFNVHAYRTGVITSLTFKWLAIGM